MREEEKKGRRTEVTSFSPPSLLVSSSRDAIFSQDDNGEYNAGRREGERGESIDSERNSEATRTVRLERFTLSK